MKPVRRGRANPDLFRERLDAIINMRHGLMPWSAFDESFGKFFKPIGRPAKPTRLMVGLHDLKHVYDLSDEEVVERWVENPYRQYFCGFEFFQHSMPIDPPFRIYWDDPLAKARRPGRVGGGFESDGRGRLGDRDGEAVEPGAGDGGHQGSAEGDHASDR